MLFRKAAAVWWYVARAGMFQEHLLRCLNRFAQGRLDRGEGTFDGRVVGQRLELVERLVACQARRSDQRIQHRIRAFGNAEGVATHLLPNTARNRTDAVEERGSPSEGLKLLADGQLDVKFSRVPRSGATTTTSSSTGRSAPHPYPATPAQTAAPDQSRARPHHRSKAKRTHRQSNKSRG